MRVYARNLNVLSQSRLEAGIYEGAEGTRAGDITIDATEAVTIDGPVSKIINYVQQYGNGNAGDIFITARSLDIINGGQVNSQTNGNGNGGNIQINATNVRLDANYQDGGIYNDVNESAKGNGGKIAINADTISLDRASDLNSVTAGNGNAGQIDLNTRTLTITRGAKTAVNTITEGLGGNLTINARESILVDGYGTDNQGQPLLSDYGPSLLNSQIIAGVFNGSSRGGDLRITTGRLSISNSGQVTASSFSAGRAGDIVINASQSINLTGRNDQFNEPSAIIAQTLASGDGGDILINTGALTIGDNAILAANSIKDSTGKAGNINVNAKAIAVEDAAKIAVNSTTSGRAGEIILQTDQLNLRNRGTITAQTDASQGGNITLNVKDILLLRQNSTISTSAGLAGAGGDGGNITINAPQGFLVSLPNSNSDITANAFNGRGGRVTIAANRIYQFTPRSRAELVQIFRTENPAELDAARLFSNDITAIAQGNPSLGGTVNLLTPDTDPSRGLIPLPNVITDPADRLDQRCAPNSNVIANEFTVTGPGGLPSRPTDRPSNPNTLARLAQLPSSAAQASGEVQPTAPIVEAQAATRLSDGTIRLRSRSPEANAFNPIAHCMTQQSNRT